MLARTPATARPASRVSQTKTSRAGARAARARATPRRVVRAAVADEAAESELEQRMKEVMQMEQDMKVEKEESTMRQTFPLAAVIPPRVAAGRAFFPDTLRWEFSPSRRLGSASLFTELRLMKRVCLARRASPIAACG